MTALIYCPFPDEPTATEVGQVLLHEGLIGCINIGNGIQSLFAWNGEQGSSNECPALLKTSAELLERSISRLEDLHPYEAPAILGWRCIAGSATTNWLSGLEGGTQGVINQ